MTPNQREHMTELALIRAIPDMILGRIPKGRISNIYKKLQKYVDKILCTFPQVSALDKMDIQERIFSFGRSADWERREVDITTLLSFVLDLIENSKFEYPGQVIAALNEAFEFLTQSMNPDELSEHIKEAERAADIWRYGMVDMEECAA